MQAVARWRCEEPSEIAFTRALLLVRDFKQHEDSAFRSLQSDSALFPEQLSPAIWLCSGLQEGPGVLTASIIAQKKEDERTA